MTTTFRYGIIKAYFIDKGMSNDVAATTTQFIIDAAILQDVNPMSLLDQYGATDVSFSDTLLYNMNGLADSTSAGSGTSTTNKNSQSYKAKHIAPFTSPFVPLPNVPPTANFSYVADHLECTFTDTSTDGDGTVVAYEWDFDDTFTSIDQHPTHLFTSNGTYNVQLTVTDDDGATDTSSQLIIVVANLAPNADFSHTTNHLECTFTDLSTDGDGTIINWLWDFDDTNTSAVQNPNHTFAVEGIYNVSLTVTDDDGVINTTSQSITVIANIAPTSNFSYIITDLDCVFTDLSTDSDGTIINWLWDFDDTNTSSVQNPNHSFVSAGTYNVQLTVTDDDGDEHTISQSITSVAPNVPPVADYSYVFTDLDYTFTDLSTDSDGTVTNWLWDFDDTNTSTTQSPNHTFATGGTYNVQLTVTDDDGAMHLITRIISANAPPIANFSYVATHLDCVFTDLSSDIDGTITNWLWDFDDTNTSTTQSPNHTFATGGTYNVQLTVTDDDGAINTTSQSVTVIESAIYAVCPLDPYANPPGTSTLLSFWDFMEKSNPVMWLNDSSAATNADTDIGRFDDRANPGKYVVSINNPGGLRCMPSSRYPFQVKMSTGSNNDWSGQAHGSTYGNLEDTFTIITGFDHYSTASTGLRKVSGCYENNSGSDEWCLYTDNNVLKFRYYIGSTEYITTALPGGTFSDGSISGEGVPNINTYTDNGILVIQRDDSSSVEFPNGRITFRVVTPTVDITYSATNQPGNIRRNSQYFKMRWLSSSPWTTPSYLELYNYSHYDRLLSETEQLEYIEWMRYARMETTPHAITDYFESRMYRSGVVSYLTFEQDNATTLIDEETLSWNGFNLTGATDTSSNTYSLALPDYIGGGTGQTISPTVKFVNNQLGSPYFDFTYYHAYNIEFLIAGVQSSNGNLRTIISKWGSASQDKYMQLELTTTNELIFRIYRYISVYGSEDVMDEWVIAKLGEHGSELFETDDWQTVHLRVTSSLLLSINNTIVFNSNSTALGGTGYTLRTGYDNPTMAEPSYIGGGSAVVNAGNGIIQGATAMFDTFTGPYGTDLSAHTPDLDTVGNGWAQELVNDGELDGTGGLFWSSSSGVAWIDIGQTDQFVKINVNPGGDDNRFSIHLRHDGSPDISSTAYYFNIRIGAGGAGEASIMSRIAGINTTITDIAYLGTPDLNTTHEFVAGVVGNELSLYMNGSKILTYTDNSILAGTYIGIRHNAYRDGNLRYHDVTAGTATSANDATPGAAWELGIAHFSISATYAYARDTGLVLIGDGEGHSFRDNVMQSWKFMADGDFYDYPYSIWDALYRVAHRNAVTTDGWYYSLLDQPGTNAPDGGVNDQDLTYHQDRSTVGYEALLPQPVGRWGINLDGTIGTTVASIANDTCSIRNDTFTIFCLFARTAVAGGQTLMGKWGTNYSTAQWVIQSTAGDPNRLDFAIIQDDGTQQTSIIVPDMTASGILPDGEWHSLLIQCSPVEMTTRIDSIVENPTDTTSWSGSWRSSTTPFMIGGTGGAGYYWEGKIAGVVVLNDAITDCEAADIEQTFLLGYAPAP